MDRAWTTGTLSSGRCSLVVRVVDILKALALTTLVLVSIVGVGHAADPEAGALLAKAWGCSKCHGADGIGTDVSVPNLAGQKVKYLRRQLGFFRRAKAHVYKGEKITERTHPVMDDVTALFSDANIESLAAFYARLPCSSGGPTPPTRPPAKAEQCEVCHGGKRTSPFKDVPKIAGQKKRYLVRQMGVLSRSAKDPARHSRHYHRMAEIAVKNLTRAEIAVLAEYYSRLPCR